MPGPLDEANELRKRLGYPPITQAELDANLAAGAPKIPVSPTPTSPPMVEGEPSPELAEANRLRANLGYGPIGQQEFEGNRPTVGAAITPTPEPATEVPIGARPRAELIPARLKEPIDPTESVLGRSGRNVLAGLELAGRPFQIGGALLGRTFGGDPAGAPKFAPAIDPLDAMRILVAEQEARGLGQQLLTELPFGGVGALKALGRPLGRGLGRVLGRARPSAPVRPTGLHAFETPARSLGEDVATSDVARPSTLLEEAFPQGTRPGTLRMGTEPARLQAEFGGFQPLADELGGSVETAGETGRGLLGRAAAGAAGEIGLTLPKSLVDARRGLKSAAGLDLSELRGQIQELPGGPVIKGARIFGELTGETLRAGLASGDVTSAVLRQGFIETPAHPIRAAASFKDALSTLLSQENFDKLRVLRQSNLRYDDYVRTGALKQLGMGGAEDSDEFYKSLLASKLPIIGPMIKASNRVFATFINEMGWRGMDDVIRGREKVGALTERAVLEKQATDFGFDTLDALRQASNKATMGQRVSKSGQVLDVTTKGGIEWTDEIQDIADLEQARFIDIQAWGTAMNHMLGRGGLPVIKYQGREVSTASFFNHAFFAPGLTASYAQIPIDLATNIFKPQSRWVVGEMAKDLAKAMAVGASVMAVIKMSRRKDVKIVDDPLRADFGDVQMGTQRFNIWAGYQPIVRTAYQWRLNERLYSGTDIPYHPGRANIAWGFIRSKLHPRYSLAAQYVPALFGETPKSFTGDPIEASFAGVTKEVREHMAMLFWQDLADALGNEGLMGLTALVGNFGIGSQSYEAGVEKYWKAKGWPGELRDQDLVTQQSVLENYWASRPPRKRLFQQPGSRFEIDPFTGKERRKDFLGR